NFIEGDTDALDLGSVTTTRESTLKLGALDNNSDTASGFAIAVGEFDIGNHRFYIGLLSNTALGAPLNDAMQGGIWTAKIRILTSIKDNPPLEADFKLNVDFATKSLKIVNDAGADANINFAIGNSRLAFIIDGKFTANGVIYGTVDFTGANNNGTLTGLIGQNGAVGIFKRNGGGSPYVGGFVAAKTDCTVTPFAAGCTDYDKQAELCNNHDDVQVDDFNANCRDNIEVTDRVCAFRGTYSNAFNYDICPAGAGNDGRRTSICLQRDGLHAAIGKTAEQLGFANAAALTTHCAGDSAITKLVCATSGGYANPFDRGICLDETLRAEVCRNRVTVIIDGVAVDNLPDGVHVNIHCAHHAVRALICIPSGDNANPFDNEICPDTVISNNEARAQACRDRTLPSGVNLADDCAGNLAITNLICASRGALANPFDSAICTGNHATTQSNLLSNCQNGNAGGADCTRYTACQENAFDNVICPDAGHEARAQLCLNWVRDGLPDGISVRDDCAGDSAITDLICADRGASANPFDTSICTGDQTSTQSDFVNNCRLDNAEGSITTTAGGANCTKYTDCRDNPFRAECDETYYEPERHAYVGSVLAYCGNSNRASVTAPVGYTDVATDCVTEQVRSQVCASSGKYANPFDAEVCPAEYCVNVAGNYAPVISAGVCPADYTSVTADIATIQSEFATACYNARNAASLPTQCTNINTCFDVAKLGVASETSDVG
ncbi:MAG: hypothetical protein K8953_12005, partial [Proteobacteria bacterium]|nr:hypothetical protein [Pseudomonadota bacterium]